MKCGGERGRRTYMNLSLLTSVIDFVGQVLRQTPQPKHFAELKTILFSAFNCLALNWQRWTHVPQLLQVT